MFHVKQNPGEPLMAIGAIPDRFHPARPPVDRLAALAAVERMHDGPVPAAWRRHILRGGAPAGVSPLARARAHVRGRIAQVRGAPAWQRARAQGWLRDALAAYRAAQARMRSEALAEARRAVRAALTRAADWRAAQWRGRLTGSAYRAVARATGLAAALHRYRRLQRRRP